MYDAALVKMRKFYPLPYCNLFGLDTEYLISNPNQVEALAELYIWGKKVADDNCLVFHYERIKLGPHCTQVFKIPTDLPPEEREHVNNYAGHAILIVEVPMITNILYYSSDKKIVGEELVGPKDTISTEGKTYAFGFRTSSIGTIELNAVGFISNLTQYKLSAKVAIYDQLCKLNSSNDFTIRPFCSAKFEVPEKLYGYGRIEVNHPALINIMHLNKESVASAELIKDSHKVEGPAYPESGRNRILFDARSALGTFVSTFSEFKAVLQDKGYQVEDHTEGELTTTILNNHDVLFVYFSNPDYTDEEKNVLVNFVKGGRSLMVIGEWGHGAFSDHIVDLLPLFGATYDDNTVEDLTHCQQDPYYFPHWVLYDSERNFNAHPVLLGIESIMLYAHSTLSGAEWNNLIVTDDDAVPSNRPVVISRLFGEGRILVIGDSNFISYHIDDYNNKQFGVQCIEWLLFMI